MTADFKSDVVLPPEIIKYQAILSKDPGSMVFAPLAEAYRKIGMLDEAIATAREGNKLRPGYVSGMVALGRACFENGLLDEARENLLKVLAIAPDNIIAAGLVEDIKNKQAEAEVAVESSENTEIQEEPPYDFGSAEEEAIEVLNADDFDELTELEEVSSEVIPDGIQIDDISFEAQGPGLGLIKESTETEFEKQAEDGASWGETVSEREEDPYAAEAVSVDLYEQEEETRPKKEITTETIADLYIKQGYLDKAIDIYQTLNDAHPGNADIKRKLDELKRKAVGKIEIAESKPVELDEDIKYVASLESWLEVIQSKRRKG